MFGRRTWEAIGLLPVAAVFAWSGLKIWQHLAVPASQPPGSGVYIAALVSGAVLFGVVGIAGRASDRRSEAARINLAREQLRREAVEPDNPA